MSSQSTTTLQTALAAARKAYERHPKAIGCAAVALGAYAALSAHAAIAKRLRVRGLGGAVPYEDRAGVPVTHGSRIEASVVEQLFLKVGALCNGTGKITLFITLEGPMTPEAVHAAAAAMFARHPSLRVKVVSSDGAVINRNSKIAFEVDNSTASALPLRFHAFVDAGSLSEAAISVWRSFELTPLQPGSPLWRLDVVTAPGSGDAGTVLLLTESHALSDGISLQAVAHEMLTAIANYTPGAAVACPDDSQRWPEAYDVAIAPKGFLSLFRRLKLFKVLFGLPSAATALVVPTHDPSWTIQHIMDRCRSVVIPITLSQADTAALLAGCRAHGTTVTAALTSALAMASVQCVHELEGESAAAGTTIVGAFPVEMRSRLTPPVPSNVLAYFTSAIVTTGPTPQPRTPVADMGAVLWESAVVWRERIEACLGGQVHFAIGMAFSLFAATFVKEPSTLPHKEGTVSLSSWGKQVVSEAYTHAHTGAAVRVRDAAVFPSLSNHFGVPTFAVTCAGKLCLTLAASGLKTADGKGAESVAASCLARHTRAALQAMIA